MESALHGARPDPSPRGTRRLQRDGRGDASPQLGRVGSTSSTDRDLRTSKLVGDRQDYWSQASPNRFATILSVRQQGSGDASLIEGQYPDLKSDPDSWGYDPRSGTGIPCTGPEFGEIRGHGLSTGDQGSRWKDARSRPYKRELVEFLESKRTSGYADLPNWVWVRLLTHVEKHSPAYWIEGAKATVLKGYVVGSEEAEGPRPVIQQPTKRSPVME